MVDINDIIKRKQGEDYTDYFVRLFENIKTYGLNSDLIAELLNHENGQNFGESTYRKKFADFNRGRIYERTKGESGINKRILSISDLHVPFQLPVETFSDYVGGVDVLQLNGDVSDCQAISKFPKAYRISPMEELIETRQYIISLIEFIKPKKVSVNYGNHDLRFQSYFSKSIDTDILELMPKTSLELIFVDGFKHYNKRERTKIEYKPLVEVIDDVEIDYTDNWFSQIGETIFCHPLAFSSGILKTAEKAVYFFRNEGYNFTSLVMAHTHRVGEYTIGNTTLYEQGCCCDTKANNYSDGRLGNSQKEGYIYICQDKNGKIIKDKTKLVCLN
ncbi:MAG: metallophosphoesterase [Vagococcus sp.]|jgi:predicted phosphodiesterase|nr:metallophosphoesterase [Vagococcus sp.]